MRDFSDPGYDWLGELLASRGYILAFINEGIRSENDGRGWLLLKHLQAWRRFNENPDGPFHGRFDMGNIALVGHSRGGEVVALAAAFNRLARYPDDAVTVWGAHDNGPRSGRILELDGRGAAAPPFRQPGEHIVFATRPSALAGVEQQLRGV